MPTNDQIDQAEECSSEGYCVECGLEMDAPKGEVLKAQCSCFCHQVV